MNRARHLATVVGVLVAAATAGCTDPTDPTNSGLYYYIRNDTPDEVTVNCDPCGGQPWSVAAGGDQKIPTSGAQVGAGDMYVITDTVTHGVSYEFIFEPRVGQIFGVSAAKPTQASAGATHAPVIGRK